MIKNKLIIAGILGLTIGLGAVATTTTTASAKGMNAKEYAEACMYDNMKYIKGQLDEMKREDNGGSASHPLTSAERAIAINTYNYLTSKDSKVKEESLVKLQKALDEKHDRSQFETIEDERDPEYKGFKTYEEWLKNKSAGKPAEVKPAEVKPTPAPVAKEEVKPVMPVVKPTPKTEAKTEVKPVAKTEAKKDEVKSVAKVEVKPVAKSEVKKEVKTEVKKEVKKAETKTKAEATKKLVKTGSAVGTEAMLAIGATIATAGAVLRKRK